MSHQAEMPEYYPEMDAAGHLCLTARCRSALAKMAAKDGCATSFAWLLTKEELDFLRMPNFSRKSMAVLRLALAEYGLRLPGEPLYIPPKILREVRRGTH